MKRILIQVGSFLAGFSVIGLLIYFTSLPALERLQERSFGNLVTLQIEDLTCSSQTECVEVFTISSSGETSAGTQVEAGEIDTLLSLLTLENVESIEYLGFTNPYCNDKNYINQNVTLTLNVEGEDKSFALCQISNLEENQLIAFVVELLP